MWKIVKENGKYFPYKKFLWFWISPIDTQGGENAYCASYSSIEEAEKAIREHEKPKPYEEIVKFID